MKVVNPMYLWALAGLAIPLAIHLLSRKEGKVLKLGSLRHVQETSTQQFRGIRLNEIALLLLRSALIVLFSLILAGILFPGSKDAKWVLVEKGLERQSRISTMVDSLVAGGYEAHWLAPAFPDFGDSISDSRVHYRELVTKLGEKNLASAIVFSSNTPRSFAGEGMSIGKNIHWISQPHGNIDYSLQSVRVSNDSVVSRIGHSNANITTYRYASGNDMSAETVEEPVITIGLIADKKYDRDRKIIKAALRAMDGMVPAKINIEEDPTKAMRADWRVWLSDNEPPLGKVIRLSPGQETDLLLRTGRSTWQLTKRLNQDLAIESNLSVELAGVIFPEKNRLIDVAANNDRRLLPDSLAWSFNENGPEKNHEAGMATTQAESFLLVLFLLVLTSERFLAYHRKQ